MGATKLRGACTENRWGERKQAREGLCRLDESRTALQTRTAGVFRASLSGQGEWTGERSFFDTLKIPERIL